MKYVLYMHYGSGNHGCEAIVKSTSMLLNDPHNSILWTLNRAEDIEYGVGPYFSDIIVSEQLDRFSLPYFSAQFQRRILHREDANYKVFLRTVFKDNIALCVGGDNYCYEHSARQAVELNKEIRKYAKATVLWGCSVNEEAITTEVETDLKKYDLITAREPITYELLKRINPNTVKVADPAFILNKEINKQEDKFDFSNTVGINVSPLIMKYTNGERIILSSYKELMNYILLQTDMKICLIPHVVCENNNDLEPIKWLYENIGDNSRVFIANNSNASQLKGYISQCRFFVGARTHATIAAYSSCVPTLAVGYSVKSRGIARDLFDTDKNYVLPVQSMKDGTELTKHFEWLVENEKMINNRLNTVIPDYINTAKLGAELAVKLTAGKDSI